MTNNSKISNITFKNSTRIWLIVFMITMAFFLFGIDLLFGSVKIPFKELVNILLFKTSDKSEWVTIIFNFRFPKAVTAALAGAALSVSGLQMQTVFRNPLAGPYVLGISSGASLGVAILVLGFSSFIGFSQLNSLGNWAIVIAAWLGSGLILVIILMISLRIKDIMTILILGIMFASISTAIVSILQYFSNETLLKSFVVWTMGSLGSVSRSQLDVLLPCVLTGLIIVLFSSKMLNTLLLGENYAKTTGLNIKLSRIIIFISTSLLAGSITAFCGPIGFIGIAVPHLTRLIFKTANHNILTIGTILTGIIVMLISDIFSQLPGMGATLPINSITALLGIPVIIWLIIDKRRFISV